MKNKYCWLLIGRSIVLLFFGILIFHGPAFSELLLVKRINGQLQPLSKADLGEHAYEINEILENY